MFLAILQTIPLTIAGACLFVWINRLVVSFAPALTSGANWYIAFLDMILSAPAALDEWLLGTLGDNILVTLIIVGYISGLVVLKPITILAMTSNSAIVSLAGAPPEVGRMSTSALEEAVPGWRKAKMTARWNLARRSYLGTAIGAARYSVLGGSSGLALVATRYVSSWSGFWGTAGSIIVVSILGVAVWFIQEIDSIISDNFEEIFDSLEA